MKNDSGLFIPLYHEMEVLADFSQHWSYDHPHYSGAAYPNAEWHDIEKVLKHPDVSDQHYHAWYHSNGLRAITRSLAHRMLHFARRCAILTDEQLKRAQELKLL